MRLRRRNNYNYNNNNRYLTLNDSTIPYDLPPLRTEDEYYHGITFVVKLVGYGNVPRPTTRMEIITAMRRIRQDCRLRKDKKYKTIMKISNDGLRLAIKPLRRRRIKFQSLLSSSSSNTSSAAAATTFPSSTSPSMITNDFVIINHPIHRIFYVSHDSLDLHIFSYIAREGSIFKCFVFKAAKKSLAINIVRTIGQAFELCHKTTPNNVNNNANNADHHHHQNNGIIGSNNYPQRPKRANNNNNNNQQRLSIVKDFDDNNNHNNDNCNNIIDDDDVNNGDNQLTSSSSPLLRRSTTPTPTKSTTTTTSIMSKLKQSKSPPPPPLNSHGDDCKDFTFNMEQMIYDVDCKLDRISNKIELLEKQITSLISSMTINDDNHDHDTSLLSNHKNYNRSNLSNYHHHPNNRSSFHRRSPTVRFSESAERMFVHNNPRASSVVSTDTNGSETNTLIGINSSNFDDQNNDDDDDDNGDQTLRPKKLMNNNNNNTKQLNSPDSLLSSPTNNNVDNYYNYSSSNNNNNNNKNLSGCLLFRDLY